MVPGHGTPEQESVGSVSPEVHMEFRLDSFEI